MKVNGPGQPSVPDVEPNANPVDKAGTAEGARGPSESGPSFADKLSPARPTESAAAAQVVAVGRPGDIAVADLAADIGAGRLTPRDAVDRVLDRVLDRVVDRQVGSEAPTAVRDQVRAALEDALETDPLLADKLRRLQ